jgi:hypothetical protein
VFNRFSKGLVVLALATGLAIVSAIASCGGDDGTSPSTGPPGNPTSDFITMSVDGGGAVTYAEASGLPTIDCNPRVDWASYQVVLWDDFTGGIGPNGYDKFFEVMFPAADTVGTYTVQGDFCQSLYYDGSNYTASPILNTSSGTVQVTRSDTRIEGTFTITVVDAAETTSINLTGSFGVDRGWSLSCP